MYRACTARRLGLCTECVIEWPEKSIENFMNRKYKWHKGFQKNEHAEINTKYVWNEDADANATRNSLYSMIVKGRPETPFMWWIKNVKGAWRIKTIIHREKSERYISLNLIDFRIIRRKKKIAPIIRPHIYFEDLGVWRSDTTDW